MNLFLFNVDQVNWYEHLCSYNDSLLYSCVPLCGVPSKKKSLFLWCLHI